MQNDGFNRIVVTKFFDLLHYRAGIEDDAFQFNHANLVAKTGAQGGVFSSSVERDINQRKYCQDKEEEGPSPNYNPEQRPGTSVFRHTDCIV